MMKAYYYSVLPLALLLCSCVLEGGAAGPAGGYVFYDKGEYYNGWRYLECAPPLENALSHEERSGNWTEAKTLCEASVLGDYINWSLPTRQELKWMYSNLHEKGMGAFKDDNGYWSLEEANSGAAYCVDFADGKASSAGKSASKYIRPVRKF